MANIKLRKPEFVCFELKCSVITIFGVRYHQYCDDIQMYIAILAWDPVEIWTSKRKVGMDSLVNLIDWTGLSAYGTGCCLSRRFLDFV